MGFSVKEQIIALARQDPFLTVDELACQVGTTAPYVRTVLSEADLSLNRLRKDYARQLELRLGKATSREFVVQQQLQVLQVSPQEAMNFPLWNGEELFQVGVVQNMGQYPGYSQLITALPLTIRADYGSLRDLLPISQSELVVKEQRVEVVVGPHELTEALDLPTGSQVLKLSTYLHTHGEPVAVEIHWLPLEGLVLEFSPEDGEFKAPLTG